MLFRADVRAHDCPRLHPELMPGPGELPGIQQADAWFQARLRPLRDPCSRSRFDPDALHVGEEAVRVRKVR